MIEHFFNSSLIETAINQTLALDPQAQEKLAALDGKRIAITLDFATQPWVFCIANSRLLISDIEAADCDIRLSGTLGGFLHLFRPDEPPKVGDKLYIEGDLHSAQQFQRTMAQLKPDFDTILRQRLGEKLGGAVAAAISQIKTQGEALREQAEAKLREYLHAENSQFVSRAQFAATSTQLAAISAALDDLEARLQKLEN